MIYFARFISLIGAAVTFSGLATLFVMGGTQKILPTDILNQWPLVVFATLLGGALLIIGQMAGNDLFKLQGKDGLFKLRFGQSDIWVWDSTGGSGDIGGD